MKGMELCRRFYRECVGPALEEAFPGLNYSAGLLGFGSDVLGYDDEVSRDHMWGPRLYLFFDEAELSRADDVMRALTGRLPRSFLGFPVGFGEPDEAGISAMDADSDAFRPMISIGTFPDFLEETLGVRGADGLTAADWLAFSEHKLLALQAGELFRDDLQLSEKLAELAYYPRAAWLYLLMSDWSCVGEERAFVKRTAARGDDLGSRIICARLVHRLMHLCFLYERRYAPYSKWFGTAFARLESAAELGPVLERALAASDPLEREEAVARAQAALIGIHNRSGLTEPVPTQLHSYFDREILVADSDQVGERLAALVSRTELAHLPPIGSLSTPGNLVPLVESVGNFSRLRALYR